MRQLNRIQPAGPAAAYDTYRISAPISTHRRRATCAEVDCKHHLEGWATRCDETTEDGRTMPDGTTVGGSIAAGYIRKFSDRSFVEWRDETGLTVFAFEAGQTCFRADGHTVPLERDALFIRHRGDWRKRDHPVTYDRADQWVDDFATNQNRLSTLRGE